MVDIAFNPTVHAHTIRKFCCSWLVAGDPLGGGWDPNSLLKPPVPTPTKYLSDSDVTLRYRFIMSDSHLKLLTRVKFMFLLMQKIAKVYNNFCKFIALG